MPSPVAAGLVRELGKVLPDPALARLALYADRVAATTHHGDLHRALVCAAWAVDLAGSRSGSRLDRLVARLEERGSLARDAAFGAHYGMAVADGIGPLEDAELELVDATVAVARAEAERAGWDAVPWEDLVASVVTGSASGSA